jgi:hypothetical protein
MVLTLLQAEWPHEENRYEAVRVHCIDATRRLVKKTGVCRFFVF